jgi:hypothetical protein
MKCHNTKAACSPLRLKRPVRGRLAVSVTRKRPVRGRFSTRVTMTGWLPGRAGVVTRSRGVYAGGRCQRSGSRSLTSEFGGRAGKRVNTSRRYNHGFNPCCLALADRECGFEISAEKNSSQANFALELQPSPRLFTKMLGNSPSIATARFPTLLLDKLLLTSSNSTILFI